VVNSAIVVPIVVAASDERGLLFVGEYFPRRGVIEIGGRSITKVVESFHSTAIAQTATHRKTAGTALRS
jgi:agmatine/peptidylarginine deiminase